MRRLSKTVALIFGLVFLSAAAMPARAGMMDMMGMGEKGMYNLTVGGLAGRNGASGIDKKFRDMKGVKKVHVDYKQGMVMVWVKQGATLDEAAARKIVTDAGFTLKGFTRPK